MRTKGLAFIFVFALAAVFPSAAFSQGEEEVFIAAAEGNLTKLRVMLDADPSLVNLTDVDGNTLLHAAAGEGRAKAAELLINRGASVNAKTKRGLTPLHDASFEGREEVTELLLKRGADVNARAGDGSTPLAMALSRGHEKLAELLRKHGGVE